VADPTSVFLDTAYVYALINTRDQWHAKATQWQQTLAQQQRPLVTSQFVLIEIADGLSAIGFRQHAVRTLDALAGSSFVDVVPASPQLYDDALGLYRNRADKDWGLTDCSSFVVMQQRGLHEALTSDHRFSEAAFRALLLDEP
jgi:predicted nucleic acid-binding protein